MDAEQLVEEVLSAAVTRAATEIRFKVPSAPLMRCAGQLERLDMPALGPDDTEAILAVMMAGLPDAHTQRDFERDGQADFAYARREIGRFRVSAFRQRGSISIVVRLVAYGVLSIADLNLPPVLADLAVSDAGLVVACGPGESGTTSTIAAMIDHVNRTHTRAIVCIEDPIEFLHRDNRSVIDQREVGLDVTSMAVGLASVVRQDADVVHASDIAELDAVDSALRAAEAGSLVVAGVTAHDVVDALRRLVSHFPLHRQGAIRQSIAGCLVGAVGTRLVRTPDGSGRYPVPEILRATPDVRAAIANEDPPARLLQLMASGEAGMQTVDQALSRLIDQAVIGQVDADHVSRTVEALRLA